MKLTLKKQVIEQIGAYTSSIFNMKQFMRWTQLCQSLKKSF